MSDSTKAFIAGALLPTIAFLLIWSINSKNNNNNNNQKQQQQQQPKSVVENKNINNNNNNSSKKNTKTTPSSDDESEYSDDDDSSGQLSTNDDDDSDDDNNDVQDGTTVVVSKRVQQQQCQNWGIRNVPYKMVLCVNTDLSMGKGKIAAQCCHAAVGCYERSMKVCPAAIRAWKQTGCAKIAVKCPSLDEMICIATKAKSLDIPFYLVEDAGRTQIAAGSKTVLCLFGPVSVFEGITDHLKLM